MNMPVFIQARMQSRRLPGKTLMLINNITLLENIINKIKLCKQAHNIHVLTSINPENEPISALCKKINVPCFRGSEHNVAERFFKAVKTTRDKYFIRITGDSPLIVPEIIDNCADICIKDKHDIVTNSLERSFPKGQSVEIIKRELYIENYPRFSNNDDFEHVTKFFYRKKNEFRIFNYTNTKDLSNFNLSVDTTDDYVRAQRISKKSKLITIKDLNSIDYSVYHTPKKAKRI